MMMVGWRFSSLRASATGPSSMLVSSRSPISAYTASRALVFAGTTTRWTMMSGNSLLTCSCKRLRAALLPMPFSPVTSRTFSSVRSFSQASTGLRMALSKPVSITGIFVLPSPSGVNQRSYCSLISSGGRLSSVSSSTATLVRIRNQRAFRLRYQSKSESS